MVRLGRLHMPSSSVRIERKRRNQLVLKGALYALLTYIGMGLLLYLYIKFITNFATIGF